jgi:hypothetical protein
MLERSQRRAREYWQQTSRKKLQKETRIMKRNDKREHVAENKSKRTKNVSMIDIQPKISTKNYKRKMWRLRKWKARIWPSKTVKIIFAYCVGKILMNSVCNVGNAGNGLMKNVRILVIPITIIVTTVLKSKALTRYINYLTFVCQYSIQCVW